MSPFEAPLFPAARRDGTAERRAAERPRPESRFGDVERTERELRELPARILGTSTDVLDVPPHSNEALILELERKAHANGARLVEFGNGNLFGIFKPYYGENAGTKAAYEMDHLYIRERASYLLSKHFDFDLVPPTVIREVQGEIGSLQELMPLSQYASLRELLEGPDPEQVADASQGWKDYAAMAAFDYIRGEVDRHDGNILVRVEDGSGAALDFSSSSTRLIAIDNGLSLRTRTFDSRGSKLMGPVQNFTVDLDAYSPGARPETYVREFELPAKLMDSLRAGIRNWEQFDAGAYDSTVGRGEVSACLDRAKDLVKAGCFLSPLNYRHVFGY